MRNKIVYRSWVFADPKISVATINLEQDLTMRSLGIDTFDVDVVCKDKSILQFAQNDPIRWWHRRKQMGIYYIQAIDRTGTHHYTISALSTLGLLAQTDYMGGVYNGITAGELIADICGDIPYVVKSAYAKVRLYGWLGIMSARDALLQVLFALGAYLTTDNNGVLHIGNLWDGLSCVLDADYIYQDTGTVKQDTPVTSVSVTEHMYIPGGKTEDLYEGATVQGQLIKFSAPVDNLQAMGFDILESGHNYAIVSAGSGKLTGNPYIHATSTVTKAVSLAPVRNDIDIDDCTLVSMVNSNAVADRLAEYYRHREYIEVDAVLDQERPGQVVQIVHPFDGNMVTAIIDTSSVNVDSILKGTLHLVQGYTPPQYEATVTYDHQEVISTERDFVVPDGCYRVRMAILDGGGGGSSGHNGSAGTRGGAVTMSSPSTGTKVGTNGTGGKGGAAGTAGLPGKVRIVDIDVEPGQVIHVSPGVGGAGAAEGTDGEPGSDGGKTIVTIDGVEYTTDDGGERPENGYYDVTTGTTYAVKGNDGRAGTDGTDGNQSVAHKVGTYSDAKWQDPTTKGPTTKHDGGGAISYKQAWYAWPNYRQTGWVVHLEGTRKWIGHQPSGFDSANVEAGTVYDSYSTLATVGSGPPSASETTRDFYTETYRIKKITVTGNTFNQAYYSIDDLEWTSEAYMMRISMEYGYAQRGSNGTTYATPADATVLGSGGDGGNGGGGGGGGAAGYIIARIPGAAKAGLTYSRTANGTAGSDGKDGTKGADGAPGGAILYYGVAKTIKPGMLVDKGLNFLADSTGRLLIS